MQNKYISYFARNNPSLYVAGPSLHWVLDVTFGEDNSRVRKDNAPENMAMVRHIVLNLLRGAKGKYSKDMSLKALQKKAGWGDSTLDGILMQEF